MSLGSDHKHDYPERGWRPTKLASPAGKILGTLRAQAKSGSHKLLIMRKV
jgi:hypothetical protein